MVHMDLLRTEEHCEGDTQIIKPFLYHRLTDDRAITRLQPLAVHEHDFKMHLDLLDRWGFTAITFNDYHLFQQKRLHLPRKPVIITIDDGSEEAYNLVMSMLQESGCKAVIFVPVDAAARGNGWDHVGAQRPLMSPAHLRHLSAEGIEIGSLSMTGRSLTMIPHDEARNEIAVSKQRLEMILGEPVLSFAYPLGQVGRALKSMVREAGYAFACAWSTGPGTFGDDLMEIRRLSIGTRVGAVGLALRVRAPFEIYEQCIQRTRSVFGWKDHRSVIRL
jgi:peptidoglycan/xylan/chitin deacetylase (PgdA/CDA1 family)